MAVAAGRLEPAPARTHA